MKADLQEIEPLRSILGSDSVKSDSAALSAFAVDGVQPWAVVFPQSVEQVSEIVKLAHREKWAIVPWGSGSKMGAGNVPLRLDLVLCTTGLDRVIDMDTANLTVTAQGGVRFAGLQMALSGRENRCYLPYDDATSPSDQAVCSEREHMGCFIPLMPPFSRSATLGGIIAANSGGPTRLLYGLPRDMVLGVRYVDPTGEIIGVGGKTVKNVSGYDMCKLMVGSRGSLGILCEMTLKLLPLPERMETCLLSFPSFDQAAQLLDRIFETRLLPAAVELLNSDASEVLIPEGAREMERRGYALAIALEGVREAVQRMHSEISEMALLAGAESTHLEEGAHRIFWDALSNLATRLSVHYPEVISFRLNYPIADYAEMIKLFDALKSEYRLGYALQAHAGSGIALIHFLMNPEDGQMGERILIVVEQLLERCQGTETNLFVERADPHFKQRLPVWGLEHEDLGIMKRIKERIDPSNILCPGRFVGGI